MWFDSILPHKGLHIRLYGVGTNPHKEAIMSRATKKAVQQAEEFISRNLDYQVYQLRGIDIEDIDVDLSELDEEPESIIALRAMISEM